MDGIYSSRKKEEADARTVQAPARRLITYGASWSSSSAFVAFPYIKATVLGGAAFLARWHSFAPLLFKGSLSDSVPPHGPHRGLWGRIGIVALMLMSSIGKPLVLSRRAREDAPIQMQNYRACRAVASIISRALTLRCPTPSVLGASCHDCLFHVFFSYGTLPVLTNVSFTCGPADRLVVVGPNGINEINAAGPHGGADSSRTRNDHRPGLSRPS